MNNIGSNLKLNFQELRILVSDTSQRGSQPRPLDHREFEASGNFEIINDHLIHESNRERENMSIQNCAF